MAAKIDFNPSMISLNLVEVTFAFLTLMRRVSVFGCWRTWELLMV